MRPLALLGTLLLSFCARITLAVEAGDEAPPFTLPALRSDAEVRIADYRGKVVYLDFWASWCPPCLVSLPLMSELRDRYVAAGEPFEVIAVNVDTDTADALDFLDFDLETPLSYLLLRDPAGRVPALYDLPAMPTSYLIDAQGRVRLVHEGFRQGDLADIEAAIDAVLEETR